LYPLSKAHVFNTEVKICWSLRLPVNPQPSDKMVHLPKTENSSAFHHHKFIDIVFELHKPNSNHCSWIGNLVSLHFTAWWTWTMVIIVQEALNSNSPNGHLYLLTSNSIHTKSQFHKNCYAFTHGRFIELQETVNGSYYNQVKFLLKKNQRF
jgi:hypothetical protein